MAAVTDRIAAISRGAEAVAAGNLEARVPAVGNDEVAALARAFNTMAAQLQAAQQQQQELAAVRRDLIAWAGHGADPPARGRAARVCLLLAFTDRGP